MIAGVELNFVAVTTTEKRLSAAFPAPTHRPSSNAVNIGVCWFTFGRANIAPS